VTSAFFRARRYLGSKDRAAISELLYTLLRHRARLDWWLEHLGFTPLTDDPQRQSRAQLIAYMILAEKKEPDVINTLFSDGKYAPAALDETETKLIRKLVTHTLFHPHMPEAVAAECPDWAAASLHQRFGRDFTKELQAMLDPAPLDLRINPLKTNRDAMVIELKKLGLKVKVGSLSPFCIRVAERPSLAALPMLKDGSVEIQDEGSQLVAQMVDAKPGHRTRRLDQRDAQSAQRPARLDVYWKCGIRCSKANGGKHDADQRRHRDARQ